MTTPKELAGETLRYWLASAARDWVHKQPFSKCGAGSDTCPDWKVAFEIVDELLPIIEARDKARAEEFRRLAVEALEISQYSGNKVMTRFRYEGKELAFRQAAQMLEERLNGDVG